MRKIHENNSFVLARVFLSYKDFFLLKTQKTTTLQQVAGGNTPNIVLKRMLRYFLKTPPFKKILQFQEKKCFFY